MRLHLVVWPPMPSEDNPASRFAAGKWQMAGLELAREMRLHLSCTDGKHHLEAHEFGETAQRTIDAGEPVTKEILSTPRPAARAAIRMLLSYHYYGKLDLDVVMPQHFKEPYPEIFVDSGAFSAETQGLKIDRLAYQGWLKRNAHWITCYANLDVIGDPIATRAQQQQMEDDGFRPIPCYHVGESWEHFEWYLDRYDYIAIGGMVPYLRRSKQLMPTLVRAFQMAQGRAALHGFGATSWAIASMVPWFSVDSSSWAAGVRYGQLQAFDPRIGKFHPLQLGAAAEWMKHAKLVRSLGFDPNDFADRARNDRRLICGFSAVNWLEAERWLQKRHASYRHVWPRALHDRASDPPRIHLAEARPSFGDHAAADAAVKQHATKTPTPSGE